MPSLFASSRWLALIGLAVLLVGCNEKKGPTPDAPGAAPAKTHTGAPLTENDCKEFGEKLEKAVATGDSATVAKLFRVVDLLERSLSDLGLSADEMKRERAGAATAISQFPEGLIRVVKAGGSYSVLRVRTVDGRPRALLRLIHGEGAVNYHEFTLLRYPDQQIAAEDAYIYAAGEQLSQTFRRFALSIMAEQNKGAIAKLRGNEQALAEHIDDITKLGPMARNGQNKEALAIFRKLPPDLQMNKSVQLLAIQAAAGTGDDNDYLTEAERFRKNHPNDSAGDLIAIGYYSLKKNHDEVLKAIDRLDKSLGGDPYLEGMKADGLADAGRFKEARASVEKAIKDAPKLSQLYWFRATVATKEKNHNYTLESLKAIVENVDPALDPDNLSADERFVDFVKTPQFDEFKKWRAARPK